MELLKDYGHEQDTGDWTLSGGATRSDAQPYEGAWSVLMISEVPNPPFPGLVSQEQQTISLQAGDFLIFTAALYRVSGTAELRFRLTDNATAEIIHEDTLAVDTLPVGAWVQHSHGWVVIPRAMTATVSWRLRMTGTAGIYIDAESVQRASTVAKGFEQAYVALYNRLRSINGSAGGYHHDIGGRVVTSLRIPGRDTMLLPAICCPIDSDLPYDEGEDYLIGQLRVAVIFWVKREGRDGVEASDAINVCRAHDDLIHALMPTNAEAPWWDLGEDRIAGVSLGAPDLLSHQTEDFPPRVKLFVILKVVLHPDELGP